MSERWPQVALGEVANLDVERVAVASGEIYRIAGVLNAGRGLFARDEIDGASTNYSVLHRLRRGQLVMRKLTAWEGPITVVPQDFDGYFVSSEFPTFTLDNGKIEPDFMRLVCQTPKLWEAMKGTSTGTVQRRKRVNPTALLAIAIDLPPLPEQRRIAHLVRGVDEVLDTQRCLLERTRAAKQQALMSALYLSDAADDSRVVDLLDDTIGGLWGKEPGREQVDVEVVRSTNFDNDGSLTFAEAAHRSITQRQLTRRALRAGDILLEKSGGGPKQPVGRTVFVPEDAPAAVCSNFVQLIRPREDIDSRWLFCLMWCSHAVGDTLSFQSATTGIRNLRTNDYLARVVGVPDRATQRRIGELGTAFDDEIARLRAHGKRLHELRRAILGVLLAGDHEIPASYDCFLEKQPGCGTGLTVAA